MDWITEHWPWLAMLISGFIKLIHDHFMIKDHDDRIEHLEDVSMQAQVGLAELARDIKHIKLTADVIAKRQGIQDEDIKDILKNKESNSD